MAVLEFSVRGISGSPLLTHNPSSMLVPKQIRPGKNIPTIEEEAESGVYRSEEGFCGVPGIGFRNGIVYASSAYRAGKRSMSSIMAHILVAPELVLILDNDGEPVTTWHIIDRRRVIVQRQGIIRARPRWNSWRAKFTVEYDENLINDPNIIRVVAADAGNRMGIGDYRPPNRGWFGRYAVDPSPDTM